MSIRPKRYPKPNLLVMLTFFVGFGVVVTTLVQAAETAPVDRDANTFASKAASGDQWLRSARSVDFGSRLHNWKSRIQVHTDGDGMNLLRVFGDGGPALRVSSSTLEMKPAYAHGSVDSRLDDSAGELPDAYLFLYKRW